MNGLKISGKTIDIACKNAGTGVRLLRESACSDTTGDLRFDLAVMKKIGMRPLEGYTIGVRFYSAAGSRCETEGTFP